MNTPPLTDDEIAASAAQIVAARASLTSLLELPHRPRNDSEAYAIQQRVVAASSDRIGGWKIGATSVVAQNRLGCTAPFSGPVFAGDLHESGAVFDPLTLLNPMMEPEIAVVLGEALGGDGPTTVESARAAVSEVRPSIELVGGCFADPAVSGYRSIIADRGANLGVVLGPAVDGWRDVALSAVPVSLTLNGELAGTGVGADALGGAIDALVWLADHLSERGLRLCVGDIVTTGTVGGATRLGPGDRAEASHGVLGGVSFRLRERTGRDQEFRAGR